MVEKQMLKLVSVVLSTVILASCGGSDSETSTTDPKIGQVQDDLNVAKQIWQDNGLVDYTFDYYSIPNQGCMPDGVVSDPLPHRSVTVEDNEIVYVENKDTGEPTEIASAGVIGTIDGIFDYLEQKLSEEPAVISESYSDQKKLPIFDESFGFPKSFYIRIDHNEGCDSVDIYLNNFR